MLAGKTLLVGCPLGALASLDVDSVCFARFVCDCDWDMLSVSEAVPSSCFAAIFRFGGIATDVKRCDRSVFHTRMLWVRVYFATRSRLTHTTSNGQSVSMLTHREFSAWIVSDGRPIPEYLHTIDKNASKVSCWIPSEAGKVRYGEKYNSCHLIVVGDATDLFYSLERCGITRTFVCLYLA